MTPGGMCRTLYADDDSTPILAYDGPWNQTKCHSSFCVDLRCVDLIHDPFEQAFDFLYIEFVVRPRGDEAGVSALAASGD